MPVSFTLPVETSHFSRPILFAQWGMETKEVSSIAIPLIGWWEEKGSSVHVMAALVHCTFGWSHKLYTQQGIVQILVCQMTS